MGMKIHEMHWDSTGAGRQPATMRPVDEQLAALLDDARMAEVLGERRRSRLLRQAAEEGATVVGALRDLAERGSAVVLATRSGRVHRGALEAVGTDVVVLGGPPPVLVQMGKLRWVRPIAGEAPTGDRPAALDVTLRGLLSRLDRPEVSVGLVGGEVAAGTLIAVGADLVTLRQAGGALVYVPVDAVEDVGLA